MKNHSKSTWIELQNQENVPISMLVIQAKGRSIYKDLISSNEDEVNLFNATSGWFSNFQKRYKFHNITMTGEAAANNDATEKFPAFLEAIIEEGGYSPK